MRVYIIEYRRYCKETDEWISKVSQEGFASLQAAQRFIETKHGRPGKCSEFYYQTELLEEYYIHDILVRDAG